VEIRSYEVTAERRCKALFRMWDETIENNRIKLGKKRLVSIAQAIKFDVSPKRLFSFNSVVQWETQTAV